MDIVGKVGTKDMKPRIFISSTFYDLKTIREELYRFIRQYNYEPIESEAGDIGYVPGRELDESCYKAMNDCDMAILIIGGRYGSPASGEEAEGEDYLSITHKEFRTAVNAGIPVYAFIEQAVLTEYELYKRNKERFENPEYQFEFVSVDSVNVFKFIAELKGISGIPTVAFSKTQDIKDFLSIQWADMFKKYLESLRKNSTNKKMTDSVEQMQRLMDKMDVMLDTVGKKILTADNSDEYENVLERQKILAVCADLTSQIQLDEAEYIEEEKDRQAYVTRMITLLKDSLGADCWDKFKVDKEEVYMQFYDYFDQRNINFCSCDENLDEKIRENIVVFENEKLKQSLIEELCQSKNYKKLFEEIK